MHGYCRSLRWLVRAMSKKYFKCATHPFKNHSNLQHTPSEYFKFATHPATNFQMCNTQRETLKRAAPCDKLSNVQYTATNFQKCNTLRETFKRAAPCDKLSDKGVLHRQTLKPQKRREFLLYLWPRSLQQEAPCYDGAVCSVKPLDSASHVAAVVVAIFTTCFPGLVVRPCRSRYQLVYVWVSLRVYYRECWCCTCVR